MIKKKKVKPLSRGSEWDFKLLKKYEVEIARIAKNFGLDTYPNQIEIISSEQMIDVYSSVGMPIGYHHWSFGKQFVTVEKQYKSGDIGLAYELIINSNPAIAYLLEENTMPMQALVIAHACYGHNSFFKGNYLFKLWTSPDSIVDYLVFARNYISECEEKYGMQAVENLLDACHALMNNGVFRYKHPHSLSLQDEKIRQRNREQYLQSQVNELWSTLPQTKKSEKLLKIRKFPEEPQENLLYFIEKNAPFLESWQREIIRITRKIAQYFYPQRQTKVMNEGWATFWHYTILNQLYDENLVTDEFMLEVLHSHTSVIAQPGFDSPYFSGFNPYTLGFNMYKDIRRICEKPTDEDKKWFPHLVNTSWIDTLDFAMRNFKDESFIAQYLSPKLIRDLKLFAVLDDDQKPDLLVSAIHDEEGYQKVRDVLSAQYNLGSIEPDIQVVNVELSGSRTLVLRHLEHDRRPLGKTVTEMLKNLYTLWQFPVRLESIDSTGQIVATYQCPETS